MLQLEIITPAKVVYKQEADEVVVPTPNGQITILPHHIALVSQVTPGELIIKHEGKEHYLAVTGGFLEVSNNTVTILADYAIRSEHIDELKAQEAKDRAEKLLKEKTSEINLIEIQAQLRKSIAELHVASRRRKV